MPGGGRFAPIVAVYRHNWANRCAAGVIIFMIAKAIRNMITARNW